MHRGWEVCWGNGEKGSSWAQRNGLEDAEGPDEEPLEAMCVSTCEREAAGGILLIWSCLNLLARSSALGPACTMMAAGQGGGRGTYREDVGAPLGLLADGRGGRGGSDGLDAQLPLADAGGGGD